MKKVARKSLSPRALLWAVYEIAVRAMYEKSLTAEEAIEMIRKILA